MFGPEEVGPFRSMFGETERTAKRALFSAKRALLSANERHFFCGCIDCLIAAVHVGQAMRASESQDSLELGLSLLEMPSPSAAELDKQIQATSHLPCCTCVCCE